MVSKLIFYIPDPYRTLLLEWPNSHPPAGFYWPHALRFHATGFCSCPRYNHESEQCFCKRFEINRVDVFLNGFLLDMIYRHEPFDFHERADDSRWELFSNPPRLHSPLQNEQTLRFLRYLPEDKWTNNPRHWHLKITTLHDHPRLNRLKPESTMNSPLEKDEELTHLRHQFRDTPQSSPPSSNQWETTV
jgi:hypothetical protein